MITALGVILTIYSILSNKCCKGSFHMAMIIIMQRISGVTILQLNIPYIRHQMTDISVIHEGGRH